MNAIEFVKKFGVEEAIKVVELHPVSTLINIGVSCVSIADLKQIVDAFDYVMEHGNIERARKYAESPYTAPEIKEFLLKSINLVEQCNA